MIEEKITHYKPSQTTVDLVRQSNLLLVAGIVCAGKDTIIHELLNSPEYRRIISHTTRAPRANHGIVERDGLDYHFIDLEQAEKMVDHHEFIEVKYVHGNVYGTSATELQSIKQADKIAVNDIDIHGVMEYLELKDDTKAIFLLPPSVDTWLRRLEKRYGVLDMNSEEIKTRFRTAIGEIEHIMGDKRFILVVNDDLQTTVDRIGKIMNQERDHTSEFAETIAEHLLEYLRSQTS